jgi:hypothetical protein
MTAPLVRTFTIASSTGTGTDVALYRHGRSSFQQERSDFAITQWLL